jgi:photosystem II stability/assembly factor-like uncharacterized protein
VQVDPSDAAVYLACGSELFKSTDGGSSWTRKLFPDGKRLWNLQFGPGSPSVLYGNQQGVIWKSADAESWARLGTLPLASYAQYLTPHPTDPHVLFAATVDGVSRSEDGGETWTAVTECPLRGDAPFRLVIDPQAPETFYLMNRTRAPLRLRP